MHLDIAKPAHLELADVIRAITSFADLSEGWDSYSARPNTQAARDLMIRVVTLAAREWRLPDRVVPSVVGGVAATFCLGTRSAFIEAYNEGQACLLLSDGTTNSEVSDIDPSDIGLRQAMDRSREYVERQPA